MSVKWKRYLLFHVEMLCIVLGFAGYAVLMQRLFPNGYLHCVLHDIFHLYCPFCGGTRAFLALLSLHVGEAFRLNSAVLVAGGIALILDLRALLMLICKKEGRLLPPVWWRIAIAYFAVYTLIRNAALLGGFDRTGDLLAFWQGRSTFFSVSLFLSLSIPMCVAFLIAIDFFGQGLLSYFRAPAAWVSALLLITLLWALYGPWPIALLYIPVCAGAGLHFAHHRQSSCNTG
ncbi:MAG: DUF2752 domain-containing protein [Clostridia bacterium]|nr:DUF2752 domain-containing protein [Clostridia bacterium]